MKNILITSTTRDNQGTVFSFVKNIEDIKNVDHREMVENSILGKEFEKGEFWSSGKEICGSESGYIFNEYPLSDDMLPITIEYIVNYLF